MGERGLRVSLGSAIAIALLAGSAGFVLRPLLLPFPLLSQAKEEAAAAGIQSVPGEADSREAEIASLQQQIAAQLEDRARLEEKFQAIRDDALELAAAYREKHEQAAPHNATPSPAAGDPEEFSRPGHTMDAAKPQKKGVSMSALRAAGFGDFESQAIRERIESIALRQLYLTDAATREGWKNSQRFHKAHRRIGSEFEDMREEYGDDRYDWILYAAGRKNRVVVDSVFGESAAAQAGLKPGDFIVGYADDRIFNGAELREATMEGRAGELVLLEYERRGVAQRVYIPRGPVGVQLHAATLPPSIP